MSKRKANNKTGINVVTKTKCRLKLKPEWLLEVVETKLSTLYRKRLTKLGDKKLVQTVYSPLERDGMIGK